MAKEISSNDPQAIELLTAKITALDAERDRNNAINKLVRKNDTAGLEEMGLTTGDIHAIMNPSYGRPGIPAYRNTNISGRIRAAKNRIEQIEKMQKTMATSESEMDLGDLTIERNNHDARLRLFFPGKPESEIIKSLKSNGFKWSPKNQAWQRQLTANAERSLAYFLNEHFPDAYKIFKGEVEPVKKAEPTVEPVVAEYIGDDDWSNPMFSYAGKQYVQVDGAMFTITSEGEPNNRVMNVVPGPIPEKSESDKKLSWKLAVIDNIVFDAKISKPEAQDLTDVHQVILDQAWEDGTNELFTAEKIVAASQQVAPEIDQDDLWSLGSSFFQAMPDKVLGVAYETSGLYGPVTKYKGDITDVEKIETPEDWKKGQDSEAVTTTIIKGENVSKEDVELSTKQIENIKAAIMESPKDIRKKKEIKAKETSIMPISGNMLSFQDVLDANNPLVSDEEMKVFIWHKWNIGHPLSGEWLNIFNPGVIIPGNPEIVSNWVKSGLVCYSAGNLLPAYLYYAENIYDRQAQLQKDQGHIVENWGIDAFIEQDKRLSEVYQQMIDNRLVISENEENPERLVVKPLSDFAFNNRIKTFVDGKPFKIRTSKRAKSLGKPDFDKTLNTNIHNRDVFSDLSLHDAFIHWLQQSSGTILFKHGVTWLDILEIYLRHRNKPTDVVKTVWARKRAQTRSEGDRLFNEFLATALTDVDKEALELKWNKEFNSFLPINYNKIPIAFEVAAAYPGNETMKIRPEKRDAIAFAFNEGSALLAYGVGVGKTWASIFIIAQFRAAGYCVRPFMVVPNQTYKQWISELQGILPNVKINDLYNLSAPYIKGLTDDSGAIVPVEDGTISIMTYEGFSNLGFSEDTRQELISQFHDILSQADPNISMSDKKRSSFREKLEEIVGQGIEGTMIDIEDLGFDYVGWDEAHAMKKVFTSVRSTKKENVEKSFKSYEITSGSPSTTALKGFMVSQYISRNNNERNVLLLTATPFTNSPLEIFSMLALVGYEKLRETNLNNLNRFFDTYVQVSYDLVINAALRPVRKQVFLGFNNLKSLQKLIFRFVDYKEPLNLKRPDKYVIPYNGRMVDGAYVPASDDETVDSILPMNPMQVSMMNDVRSYVEGAKDLEAICSYDQDEIQDEDSVVLEAPAEDLEEKDLSSAEKSGVRVLRGINYARNLALSPYLYECSGLGKPDFLSYVKTSPKLTYIMGCIKTVKEHHESQGQAISGQVIYMDRGVELFPLLAEYLVKVLGYKKHEVGIISAKMKTPKGVNRKDAKSYIQNLFLGQKFNEDTLQFEPIPDDKRIKVLIGSSSIKEGINLQTHSSTLYNAWIEWNPTDIIQLEGRIWRQKNLFEAVRIVNPILENSMDAFIFQKLEEKTSRINAIFNVDGKTNFLQTDEFSPKEMKQQLVRDPEALAGIIVDEQNELRKDELGEIENNIKIASSIKSELYIIESNKKQVIEDAEKYRPKAEGQTRSLQTYVSVIDKIVKEQTDSEGQSFNDPIVKAKYDMYAQGSGYSAPWGFDQFKSAIRVLERQKQVFLAPKKISPSEQALEGYIAAEKEKVTGITELINEANSPENMAIVTQQIIDERAKSRYRPKSVDESIKEFTRLNYLLDKKLDVTVVPKKITAAPKEIDDSKIKIALAKIKIKQKQLELDKLKMNTAAPNKNTKKQFEDLPTELNNEFMRASIDITQKRISGGDKTDPNNEPRFYNTNWRSHKKAWTALVNEFKEDTRMYDAMQILTKNGVANRSYMGMD